MSTPESWTLGLDSWIIQDGNYPDFQSNQLVEFALEHHPSIIAATESRTKLVRRVESCVYDLVGEIVYASDAAWVLNCGVLLFSEDRHPLCRVGAWLEMRAYVGVDPFFYFERLYALENMPALIYRWRIDRIHRNATPFIDELDAAGRKFKVCHPSNKSYVDAAKTDAWNDDGGHASYLLHCTMLDCPPRHRSDTAVYP